MVSTPLAVEVLLKYVLWIHIYIYFFSNNYFSIQKENTIKNNIQKLTTTLWIFLSTRSSFILMKYLHFMIKLYWLLLSWKTRKKSAVCIYVVMITLLKQLMFCLTFIWFDVLLYKFYWFHRLLMYNCYFFNCCISLVYVLYYIWLLLS